MEIDTGTNFGDARFMLYINGQTNTSANDDSNGMTFSGTVYSGMIILKCTRPSGASSKILFRRFYSIIFYGTFIQLELWQYNTTWSKWITGTIPNYNASLSVYHYQQFLVSYSSCIVL